IQTNNVGGVSVTLHTADAVNPCIPALLAVVITFTAVVSKDIAFLKSVASIISFISNVHITCSCFKYNKSSCNNLPLLRTSLRMIKLLALYEQWQHVRLNPQACHVQLGEKVASYHHYVKATVY